MEIMTLRGLFITVLISVAAAAFPKSGPASPSDICEVGNAKGFVCYKAGTLATPQTLRSEHTNDLQGCVDVLHLGEKAQSASFQSTTGNCTLYTATLAQQGYKQSSTPNVRNFDKACLQCRACSLGFANGDFETGDLKPWGSVSYPFGGNEFTVSQPGRKGSKYTAKSVQSQAGQAGNEVSVLFTSVLEQDFEACLGTTYLIRAFVKGSFEASDTDNQHYLRMYINNEDTASTTIDHLRSAYQPVNITYTANEHYPQLVFSASMAVIRNTTASFTVWVDSVSIAAQKQVS